MHILLLVIALSPAVHLIPGKFVPGTQPDGNTVVIRGVKGLIVFDTGRHPEHTQAILDFAKEQHRPVQAIVNSHWHLDHISGNAVIRREYPAAAIYASGALAGAQKGFLANYRKQLEEMIDKVPDARAEIARIDSVVGPDQVVTSSGPRTIAGRKLDLELEHDAATAGDVWLFDPATRILASGDLVTLPVPFLDTACPRGWKRALDHIAEYDFDVLVPGHGAPMHRQEFEQYRTAFGNLLVCAASDKKKDQCIDGWISDAGQLIAKDDPKFVRAMMDYYVDKLRSSDAACQ